MGTELRTYSQAEVTITDGGLRRSAMLHAHRSIEARRRTAERIAADAVNEFAKRPGEGLDETRSLWRAAAATFQLALLDDDFPRATNALHVMEVAGQKIAGFKGGTDREVLKQRHVMSLVWFQASLLGIDELAPGPAIRHIRDVAQALLRTLGTTDEYTIAAYRNLGLALAEFAERQPDGEEHWREALRVLRDANEWAVRTLPVGSQSALEVARAYVSVALVKTRQPNQGDLEEAGSLLLRLHAEAPLWAADENLTTLLAGQMQEAERRLREIRRDESRQPAGDPYAVGDLADRLQLAVRGSSEQRHVAVNDIGSEEDFLAAIDETIKYFDDGDIVEGTIVKVDRDEVLLDIGYKTEGVIPSRELSIKHDVDPSEVVAVGDQVEALVLQKEDKEGRLILSKKRAQYERAWGTIEKVKEEDGVVTGTVIEVVKGGLILDIGLRGFLPASLVEMRRVRDLQPYVGKELEAKIIELDKNRSNVVLSRRAWLEQTQSEVRQGFLTQLQKGQIRKGVVSSIVNFGAFVDLGGVDGLVHVSELSWKHIDHPSEVVTVGDEVTVEVLDVDMDRERVSLSLKATQEDPWQHFARTHQIGQIVPGKVTKLVPFGAFVRVEEGIEGLVHISELAERHVEIPEQVVQVNDDVMVKIIDIDLERRRISLSLKQANETATASEVEEFDPTLYGMSATYDEQGNYIYPEGFDPETGEWLEGFEEQRAEWEEQYARAHARWEAHVKQQAEAKKAEAEAGEATSYSSGGSAEAEASTGGALASDEALQALREKLTSD